MINIIKIICLIFTLSIPFNAYAQTKKVSVSARIKYEEIYDETVREELIEKLGLKALRKAASKFPKAKKKLMRKSDIKDALEEALETGQIVELKVQREKHNEKKKTLKIKAIATVDLGLINTIIQENAPTADGADSRIGVIAIVSRQTNIKEFKTRQVEINAVEFMKTTEEKGGATSSSAISSTSQKGMSVKESGGSSNKKASEEAWIFEAEESVNAVTGFNSKLKDLRLKARDFNDLGEILKMDYTDLEKFATSAGSLRGKHIRMFQAAAHERGWDLFGYARIKLGKAEKNPVNGLMKVAAVVQFTVTQYDDGWAVIGTVRATPAYGEATDELTARTNAVNNAVELAMENVTAQLQEEEIL